MSKLNTFITITSCLAFTFIASAETLNLSTGQARVTDNNEIIFEHISVGNKFYNATIQLDLAGSYQVKQVEEVSITPTAVYEVTFTSIWSAQNHPYEYPSGLAHLSGLIGATHNAVANFWKLGQVATSGIEDMAETGGKSVFTTEINAEIEAGNAQHLLSGGGIGTSPGVVKLQFEVSQQYPMITLVSMIAPSPDWFVGISDLSLIENGQWLENLVIPLYAYDAGTDSGTLYTSENSDTLPRATIQRIGSLPFFANDEFLSMGTFTFNKIE